MGDEGAERALTPPHVNVNVDQPVDVAVDVGVRSRRSGEARKVASLPMTRIAFTNATLFDATTGGFEEADLVIANNRIVEVGKDLDAEEVIDCTDRYILPGLIDTHVHVMFSHLDFMKQMHTPFSYRFYAAMDNLRRTLGTGITSVRDAGGADAGVRKAVEDGVIRGPRLQIAIAMLSQTGGHGDGWTQSGGYFRLFTSYPGVPDNIVDGPEAMRLKVREMLRAGADVIKVATSGGVLSPNDDPKHAHFDDDELAMLVKEASNQGKWVMAHAQATDGIKNAIRAGIRSIEHGIYLDDEAIEMMLEHGTYLVPTLIAPTGVRKAADRGVQIPESSLRKADEVVEAHHASFRKAVQAGVKIAMGTDSGVTPHGDNLEELEIMAELGMPKPDVLRASTMVAAELMGTDHEVGSLEPGKLADFVIVNGDPLDFGGFKDHIEHVWKDGRLAI